MIKQLVNIRICLTALILTAVSTVTMADLLQNHTVYKRFNYSGQLTGVISPDPDGNGPLKYPASRNVYQNGRLWKTEVGELRNWKSNSIAPSAWGSDFTINRYQTFLYDSYGRKTTEYTSSASGQVKYYKQYSYDGFDRILCETIRMNLSSISAIPNDACELGAEGDFGPDRITRTEYDSKGRILKIIKAYGTSLQQDYVTYTYDNAGNQTSVTDANGNYSKLEYDGHNRLEYWYFPSKTSVGTHSSSDYEQYSYDANGNMLTKRTRKGVTISFEYDGQNNRTLKDLPGTSKDVHYAYDNKQKVLYARFGSDTGKGIENEYTGFGELKRSTNTLIGNSTISMNNLFDANGNRNRLTFQDGQYFTFEYDDTDRQSHVYQGSSNGSLITEFEYNAMGLPAFIYRGANVQTAIEYDEISRVKSQRETFLNSSFDIRQSLEYNPANQISEKTLGNLLYHYTGNENIEGVYQSNGLNQYTTINNVTYGYDDNGNLTSNGVTSYVYDDENRLISVSGSKNATLEYDPMGRLHSISSNGNKRYFLHEGEALVAEYDGQGRVLRRYLHANGNSDAPVAMYEGSSINDSSLRYIHTNYLGSVIGLSDSSGEMRNINRYDAYGIPSQDNAGTFGFTGQVYLPEIGLYYYKARMYNPYIGRFMQVDPVGYEDQINLYTYAANDPFNANDPSGKFVNFVAKFAVDVGLNVALQVATGQPIDVGAAVKESAMGVLNPAKTLQTAAKLSKAVGKVKGASNVSTKCVLSCFVADTLVLTENGYEKIQDLEVGDVVWATDPETGVTALKPIVETYINEKDTVWELEYLDGSESGTFEVTGTHPFFVHGKGWVEVANLEQGDRLRTESGGFVIASRIADTGNVVTTYNFQVKDIHTYYVGNSKVLVHNCGGKVGKTAHIPLDKAKNGSYVVKLKDGSVYVGKGGTTRARKSARQKSRQQNSEVESIEHKAASNDKDAFMDEHKALQEVKKETPSEKILNKIESPGKKICENMARTCN